MRFAYLAHLLIVTAMGGSVAQGKEPAAKKSSGAAAKQSPKKTNLKPATIPATPAPAALPEAPKGTLLVLAGPNAGEVRYEPSTGWKTGALNLQFSSASLAPQPGTAIAAFRRSSSALEENDELYWARWTKAAGFDAPRKFAAVGFSKDGPTAWPLGSTAVVTFLGSNFKHYYSENETGEGFGPFEPIPGELIENQAFGPSATSLAGDGRTGTYAVYAGNDSHLYYTHKAGPRTDWIPSVQAPSSAVNKGLRPVALVDSEMNLRIFYVRQADQRICMVKLATAAKTWAAEETIGDASTSLAPSVTITAEGEFVVTYHGAKDQGINLVRGKDGAWSSEVKVDAAEAPTTAPIVLPGLSGADAEIIYATGGTLKHARLIGQTVELESVPGPTGVTTIAAAIVP